MGRFDDDGVSLGMCQQLAISMVQSLKGTLDAADTPNISAMTIRETEANEDYEDYEVIVRRPDGKATAQVLAERADEVDDLTAEIARLRILVPTPFVGDVVDTLCGEWASPEQTAEAIAELVIPLAAELTELRAACAELETERDDLAESVNHG